MRTGRRLAIDVGDARIGVASCDPDGILATPVETVPGRDVPAAHRRLRQLVEEYEPIEVVVGLPRSLNGGEGPAAAKVRGFRPGARARNRAVAGTAGRREDDHSDGQPGAAGLGREGQKGPVRHRPGRRRGHPAERSGVRTGVGRGHRARASKWSSDRDTVTFRAMRRCSNSCRTAERRNGAVPRASAAASRL